ncbi:class I SAM-dependent methyltransferase [Candidatus Bathyarchaeota archaeon]|nr:class I SAM-dependent methyltransferase [Candidatus Bathyarchaeota archaeon]
MFDPLQFLRRCFFAKRSIDEICLFTGEPKNEVRRKFYNFTITSQAWAKAAPKTDSEMLQFFAQTDAYIYACLRYITTDPAKFGSLSKLLKFCQMHNVQSVLDYGAGVGQYCILLSQHGIDVTYSDVYGKLWRFSEWRFKHRNLPIKMLKAEIEPLGKYDLIVCADVLPLVKNPPLIVKTLYNSLNPNGYLCLTYSFKEAPGKPQNVDNIKYADTFDVILGEIGLRYINQDYFRYFQK